MQKFGEIDKELNKIKDKFDDILIDTGGIDNKELRAGMFIADKFYIPIQPSVFDIWTIGTMVEMVKQVKKFNSKIEVYIILNRVSTNPYLKEYEEVVELLKDVEEIKLSGAIIKERVAFRKASRNGICVKESYKKDYKAVDEIINLYKEVF